MPRVWNKYAWYCDQVRLVERIGKCALIYIGKVDCLCENAVFARLMGWETASR